MSILSTPSIFLPQKLLFDGFHSTCLSDFQTKFNKIIAFLIGFSLLQFPGLCQNVKSLKKASKSYSENKTSAGGGSSSTSRSGSYSSGSGPSDASGCGDLSGCSEMGEGCGVLLEGIGHLFVLMGDGIGALATEQKRLFQRNKIENRLYALETNFGGGIGFRQYNKINPQIRLHAGWVSLEYRQNYLFDNSGEFRSREFMANLNFVNLEEFKFRMGYGAIYFNDVDEVFPLFGIGMEILPMGPFRVELWGNLSLPANGYTIVARREVGIRFHYDIWKKGFLNSSLHLGVSNQNFYESLSYPSVDIGLNYFLSFSRFLPKISSKGPETGPEGF